MNTPSPVSKIRFCIAILAALACGAAQAELVIGQVAPFSGPLAPTGTHIRAGAQLYLDAVNAKGGVHGAKLRLATRDDGYKAEETVKLTRQLVRESQPIALIGIVGTGNVEALIKENVLAEAGVVLIGARTGANSMIRPVNPWIFQVRASYAEEVDRVVSQFATVGMTRLAVFYQDDPFGKDGLASAEASIAKAKVELVAKGAYEKNTTKVENAVKTIAAAKPQGVIMVSNTAASAEFLKQSRAAGNDAQFIALSVTDGPQVAKRIGAAVAHGFGVVQVMPDPNNRGVSVARELQETYRAAQPKDIELNHTLLEGFVAAKVLVEGLRRAGPNPTAKRVREALESMRDYDAGGMFISFTPGNHAGSRYTDITVLNRDGHLLR